MHIIHKTVDRHRYSVNLAHFSYVAIQADEQVDGTEAEVEACTPYSTERAVADISAEA